MDLIATSARKLVEQLSFARVAFGAASGVALFDCAEMERLTRGVYGHVRAELTGRWRRASLPKAPAQVLVNLAQLATNALPLGGVARLEVTHGPEGYTVSAVAKAPRRGSRRRCRPASPAVRSGGLGGRWVQAYYVHVLTVARAARSTRRWARAGDLPGGHPRLKTPGLKFRHRPGLPNRSLTKGLRKRRLLVPEGAVAPR